MDSLCAKLDFASKRGEMVVLSSAEIAQSILMLSTDDVRRRFAIGNVILDQEPKALQLRTAVLRLPLASNF